MKILLKNVRIVSPASSFHGTQNDILISEGKIAAIGASLSDADVVFESPNLKVSIGWFDLGAKLGDPGLEHKEDLTSGLKAAMYGGFTEVACMPNTKPVLQTKDNVSYLKSKTLASPVTLHVLAAATENLECKAMTEVFDLHYAGALAFSDGGHNISNSGLIVRLLQYLSQVNATLMLHSEEKSLTTGGVMNEGETSVYLGHKGMPALAEELALQRNLGLLEYAGGKLHLTKISSLDAVEKVRQAKQKGLAVTCDVAVANLVFDETYLTDFDTNYKTNPPLRTKQDQAALWKGLLDGTIDAIVTDHDPQDEESKKMEFDLAEFGMTQLETAFSLLNTHYQGKISLELLMEKMSIGPRGLMGLPIPTIEIGAEANLTIFDDTFEWDYAEKEIKSKSKNSPMLNKRLKGKALAIINKGQFVDLRK
jgi:dihydroorotase